MKKPDIRPGIIESADTNLKGPRSMPEVMQGFGRNAGTAQAALAQSLDDISKPISKLGGASAAQSNGALTGRYFRYLNLQSRYPDGVAADPGRRGALMRGAAVPPCRGDEFADDRAAITPPIGKTDWRAGGLAFNAHIGNA